MSLAAGARLGPYEIVSPLRAGGMGEVYRAKDSRLNRTVAIKVLPAEAAGDAERRERFEREARAISALDHPNICALYDVGEEGSTYFLVMPCLEGQTLAERLARGALPIDEAIRIASDVAVGLDAAHRRGIVHRDLKPGNIMLTKTGVKLLDFGLAKLKKADGPLGETMMVGGTGVGVLLGTMPYMSPEQIEGREVDARSDIFALGSVIYEMLTGRRAFPGESPATVIGAIMKDQPSPISSLQPLTPPALDHVVATCLAKDLEERWQSAADIARELRWIAQAPVAGVPVAPVDPPRWLTAIAGGLAGAAIVAALAWPGWRVVPTQEDVLRLSILPPAGHTFSSPLSSIGTAQVVISPDGRAVAFVAQAGQQPPQIWVRPLETSEPRLLAGTDGAMYLFWSSDSRAIGFFAGGKLKTINVVGGAPAVVCDAPLDSRGGDWNSAGVIVFAPAANDVIYRVPATGGKPVPVTRLQSARAETSHRFPRFLPDGHHFVYVVRSKNAEYTGVGIASLDEPDGRLLLPGVNSSAQVAETGTVFFSNASTLLAQPFDLRTRTLAGDAIPIAENIGTNATSYGAFSVSRGGRLVFAPRTTMTGELRWFTRAGVALDVAAPAADYLDFELSPDEASLAVSRVHEQQGVADIWTIDLQRRIPTRITSDFMNDASVIWSPDGTELVFRSNRHGNSDVFRLRANASGSEEVWLSTGANVIVSDWSASAGRLVLTNAQRNSGFEVWTWDLNPKGKMELAVRTRLNASHGRLSPNGRWLAYASDESGQWQVYVQPFPPTGERRQLSRDGGSEPRWRGDGQELFFLSTSQEVMSVPIPGANALAAGAPRALFQARVPLANNVYRSNYTVSRDGQRFLVNTSATAGGIEPLTVIVNWPALLPKQ
jgi:serine/threonine protein kinase